MRRIAALLPIFHRAPRGRESPAKYRRRLTERVSDRLDLPSIHGLILLRAERNCQRLPYLGNGLTGCCWFQLYQPENSPSRNGHVSASLRLCILVAGV